MAFNLRSLVKKEIACQPLFQDLTNKGQQFVAWYVHRIHGASPMDAIDSQVRRLCLNQLDSPMSAMGINPEVPKRHQVRVLKRSNLKASCFPYVHDSCSSLLNLTLDVTILLRNTRICQPLICTLTYHPTNRARLTGCKVRLILGWRRAYD